MVKKTFLPFFKNIFCSCSLLVGGEKIFLPNLTNSQEQPVFIGPFEPDPLGKKYQEPEPLGLKSGAGAALEKKNQPASQSC